MIKFKQIPDEKELYKRFYENISVTEFDRECVEWNGTIMTTGYGVFRFEVTPYLAHRVSYHMHNGDLTEGLVVDHVCNNRACINPKHLQLLTIYENIQREWKRSPEKAPNTHGERNHHAKLTKEDVLEMRKLYRQGLKIAEITRLFPQVQLTCVCKVVHYHSWKHIK